MMLELILFIILFSLGVSSGTEIPSSCSVNKVTAHYVHILFLDGYSEHKCYTVVMLQCCSSVTIV